MDKATNLRAARSPRRRYHDLPDLGSGRISPERNCKIAADAFNEAYYFAAQHPRMVRYRDDMPEIELLDQHSVMKIRYGTVSEKLADRDRYLAVGKEP